MTISPCSGNPESSLLRGATDFWKHAVSEVIGGLILVGVVVSGMAVTTTILLSQPTPAEIPHFQTFITNQSREIYIEHRGGDPLAAGEFRIIVDGVDLTDSFTNSGDDPWSLGEVLSGTAPSMPGSVAIAQNRAGGGTALLASGSFTSGIPIPEPQETWYSNQDSGRCEWSFRKAITVDHTKVAATLSDFPVLIRVTDPDLSSSARADGWDILFTTADGQTILPHEVEIYTAGSGTLAAWVKIPTLSPTEDTVIFMYYGNPAAPEQEDAENTWNANYNAVWHLEEIGSGAGGEYRDSTTGNNHGRGGGGTAAQVPARVPGILDFAQDFDGTNDNINAGSAASIDDIFGAGGTVSAWIYPRSLGEGSEGRIGDKASGATGQTGWSFATYTNNVLMFRKGFGTTRGYWTTPAASVVLNEWNYITVTYNQANVANDPAMYINGISQGITEVSTPAGAVQSDAANTLILGNRATTYTFDGVIDEIRAAKTIRSPEWIATEYTNQNDPAGFISLGGEEVWWKC